MLNCLALSALHLLLLVVVLAEVKWTSAFIPRGRLSLSPRPTTKRPGTAPSHLLRHACAWSLSLPRDRAWWNVRSATRTRPLPALSSPDWVRESSNAVWQSHPSAGGGDEAEEEDEELVLEEDGVTFRRADPERDTDDSSFDAVYSTSGADAAAPRDYSIAQCTIPEVCDAYGFCSQVHALLVALTSFDPASVNEEYFQGGVDSLAEDLGVSPEEVERVCREEGIVLPFGRASRLHEDAVQSVRRALELEEAVALRGGEEEDERAMREERAGAGGRDSGPAAQSQEALESFALGEFDSP